MFAQKSLVIKNNESVFIFIYTVLNLAAPYSEAFYSPLVPILPGNPAIAVKKANESFVNQPKV